MHKAVPFAIAAVICLSSCHKDDGSEVPPPATSGNIAIRFYHSVDSLPLQLDQLIYLNQAGNLYEISDLQYFISDLTLYLHGGGSKKITSNDGIHYVDLRASETMQWYPSDQVPYGTYDSVTFTFGLSSANNISNRFPDPPERDMFWPEMLGGGYHYMKMNVIWSDTSALNPFNMHLGIGQIYSSIEPNVDSITGFVPNYFTVSLPASSFTMGSLSVVLEINMNINRWFNGPPNLLDMKTLPAGIMQNEEIMHKICQNGTGVFTVNIPK